MAETAGYPEPSALAGWLLERRSKIDQHLRSLAAGASMPPVLAEAVSEALASRGKRLRGVLAIAVGESCGLRADRLLDAASAWEMIHTSSLIIDDLPALDDAELRRGQPALHRVFGEDRAILVALALLNHAYGLLSRNHAELSPKRWAHDELVQRAVSAVGWDGTIGGEAVDLYSEGRSLDFQSLEYIHSRKTGALFAASAAAGAILADAHPRILRAVEAYAKNLGLAYQITDDILDATSTVEELGKDVGKDEGKLTFVRLAGLEGARQLSGELIDTSIAAIGVLGERASRLQELALWVRDRRR
jgi:geranylgeranyl diphosphate synthase, type II